MRGRVAATLAAGAMLGMTAQAAAGTTTEIQEGDIVAVKGTAVLCVAVTSNGLLGMGCFKSDRDGNPRPGSFTAGLARNGTVAVSRIKADGTGQRVFRRKLQGSGESYTAEVGDAFGLAGTDIGCNVARIGNTAPVLYRGVRITCYLLDDDGLRPSTYGIAISNRFAGVFAITAGGEPGQNAFVRKHAA